MSRQGSPMRKTGSRVGIFRRMRRVALRLALAAPVFCALAPAALAAAPSPDGEDIPVPERRRDQFPKDYSYAAFPYPYRLPGIGSGLSLAAGATNVADTYTDAYGVLFMGDVKGGAIGVG